MVLKPEVIHALEREQRMCVIAIERLEDALAHWKRSMAGQQDCS